MVKFPIVVPVALALGVSSAFTCHANQISPSSVVSDIKEKNLMRTLKDLDNIAKANGGNRAFGLPGYRASVDYILAQVNQHLDRVNVQTQEFTSLYSNNDELVVNVVGQDPLVANWIAFSPSTPPEGITAELVLGPLDEAGCFEENYAGLDVQNKIVITNRFLCADDTSFASRIRPAQAAGAMAVLLWNYGEGLETGTLDAPDPDHFVPAALLKKSDGEKFKTQLEAGEKIQVYFKHLQTSEDRKTWNVIAETKTGDPDAVIMVSQDIALFFILFIDGLHKGRRSP